MILDLHAVELQPCQLEMQVADLGLMAMNLLLDVCLLHLEIVLIPVLIGLMIRRLVALEGW